MRVKDAIVGVRFLYLDTAPVIYHVEGPAKFQKKIDLIFQEITAGTMTGVMGPVTLTECLVPAYQQGDLAAIKDFHDLILRGIHTIFVSLHHAGDRAAQLRAKYNLKLGDALQIATALSASCDAFLTNDFGLKRVTEIPILVLDDLTL